MPKIESLATMTPSQRAILHVETRGPIIQIAVINFENGDKNGHFGIIRRLSNKSTLLIKQRPLESGDLVR